MLSRRQFLSLAGLSGLAAACEPNVLSRLLAVAGGGANFAPQLPVDWTIPGADDILANLAGTFAANEITVDDGTPREDGYRPAAIYDALWTRDNAYVLWHYPEIQTATQRREFVTYTLSRRTTAGVHPADFIPDRIEEDGTAVYINPGSGELPFMDGIAFVVLALWSDWNLTADNSTFLAQQSAIDDCLAALPRSASGCVWSDPADPSVDYGFTDGVLKTGDVAYGTALLAWAYKMCGEMAGDTSYDAARQFAEDGLATLRQGSGWYAASSGNNSAKDDVWATVLIAAEGLAPHPDCVASAETVRDAYLNGTMTAEGWTSEITQFGLVRHLPVGQYWAGTTVPVDTYQNGGYWLTPIWDCVRAVALVDTGTALDWATEAMQQVQDEFTAQGDWLEVPYEWHNFGVGVGALGYSASAAIVNRFV